MILAVDRSERSWKIYSCATRIQRANLQPQEAGMNSVHCSPSYVFITIAVVSRWMWLCFINNWNLYAGRLKCIVLLGKERQGKVVLDEFHFCVSYIVCEVKWKCDFFYVL
jgi:hypothetical protein